MPKLTSTTPVHEINFWMSRFVIECRRQDGSEYPATSLKHLVCSVQRHLKEDLKFEKISFFDSADFADFRRTLDARMKDLNNKGVGAVKKQAEPVTEEIESKLWGMG